MSIQQNFPSTRPSLNLNFSRSQKLDPRITFTRTSSATRVNSDGLIEVVPANSPRFDFDPISGESLGLLVEEARSNTITNSENFSSAITFRGSVTPNVEISPDGTQTADLFLETTENGNHIVQAPAGPSFTSEVTYTYSVFIKPKGRTEILIRANQDVATWPARSVFTLTGSGSVVAEAGSASIQLYPNGWYRCSITATAVGSLANMGITHRTSTSVGDESLGIYIWGAQLEVGSFPTSYIPTTTSTVTRTADNASITGSNFSDFYNPSEGTFNIKYNRSLLPIGPILGQNISTSSVLNGYLINQSGTGNVIITNADGLTNITVGTSSGGKSSVAFYYSPTGHSGCLNGNSVIESLVPPTRTPVSLLFGRNPNNNTNLNGHISQLTYYPTRLSNQVLQTLTK
jgi:hypothetical protein